jgi:WD40 repeat protein/DNA-binding SARP family transcriptional activator
MDFRILGPLEVRTNGVRVALGGPKQRALLAILLLRADRVVSSDRLIEELWADDPPAAARHALEVHVSRLRKALGVGGGESRLITRAPGYLLRVTPGELDLQRFERLLAQGRRALGGGDPDAAAGALREAEGLWRGRPLADLEFEPFARVDVERLEELHLVATEERIAAELALGRDRLLVAELEALAAEHPLRERLRAQLMLALYRCGRQADALEVYRHARSALVEGVGVEPGPELRELHAAILRQDGDLLGPGRLELPQELETASPLFGRDAELARLRDAWEIARGGTGRVAVVTGPAGSGRTRLAAELAGELHRQGVVVLYGADAGARARVARRPTLLVLDDVADAEAAALIELASELASRPVLALAITEHAGLARVLPGAERLPLGPLDAEAIEAIAALYAPDGARIPVADLCERSGGVPRRAHRLAAEWARAEAVRLLSPAADRAAAERSDLRRAERQLAANVAEVQAVRERAALQEADRTAVACPYKGLSSFDVDDAGFFFGRERLVAEMVARLVGSPLLGVVGASGSGKSSAVRAGLVAELAAGVLPGSERWSRVLLRPGEHPMSTLERATVHVESDRRLLLVVDQFEEAFTLCRDEAERTAFAEALAAAAHPLARESAVVLAVRADFYARCAAYPALARLLAANHVLVGPMQGDELRRAIELPAQRASLIAEPDLVERLLSDVEHEPGGLPLLSTALLELWQLRDGRRLRLADYERTGGVRGAVARLAEAAYEPLDAAQQAVARRILLRLAGEDAGGGAVRRRVALEEFDADRDEDVGRVLGVLAGRRLVTVSAGAVEVAHEALLREWPRLRGWLADDAEGRRLHHRLAASARDWQAGGRDFGELYRGARLASTLDWAGARETELNALERAFIDASRAQGEAETRRARRTNRRLRVLLGGVLALLALAAGAGGLFLRQRGEARDQARTADARHLGAQALVDESLDRALLLARQGVALEDSLETRSNLLAALLRSPAAIGVKRVEGGHLNTMALRPDGRALVVGDERGSVNFLDPATGRALRPPYQPHTLYIRQLVFNPTGSRLAVGGLGVIRLLDGRTFRELGALEVPGRAVQFINVAFSPDGRVLVAMHETDAGGRSKAVLLRFDGRTGRRLSRPVSTPEPHGLADVTAFTPDGRGLLTADRDPRALSPAADVTTDFEGRQIVVRDPRTLRPLRSYPGFAWAGALSPDGRTFAAGGADGSVRFIDLRTGRQRTALGRHAAPVDRVLFTPDGRSLITAGEDSTAIVWDVRTGAAGDTFQGHAGRVTGLALDGRGRTLFTAAADGTVITWDLVGDRRLGRPFDAGSGSDLFPSTVISRDGRTLLTAQDDASVSIIDTRTLTHRRLAIAGAPPPDAPSAPRFTPSAPAFGPRGTIVVSSFDGFLALVDSRTGRVVGRLKGHRDLVLAPATSADGRIVAAAGWDGTARVWDARTLRQLGPPIPFSAPDGSLAVSPDGSRVAVAVVPGSLDVLDVRSQRRLAHLRVDGSEVGFSGFSRDGRLLFAGSQDGRVRVFSARDWRPLGPAFAGHAGWVASVDASPDGRTLVTAGQDGKVRLWELATRRPIGAPLPGPKNLNVVARFAPVGNHVFATFADGRGYRWDVRPTAWMRHACEVAGRRLTRNEWQDALPERDYAPAC